MKLTETQLRNLIKQELKQFLKLNEGYDDLSDLDSLDAEIPDEDEDFDEDYDEDFDDDGQKYPGERRYSPDEIDQLDYEAEENRRAFDPQDPAYVSSYKPGSTKIVSPRKIRDDADELGLYDMDNPLHRAARKASRLARK